MPSVFTDATGNGYDLTITTSADWTVSSGGLPNGDNYVTGDGSIAPTYNTIGDDFNLADGTAWSIEFWLYLPGGTGLSAAEAIIYNGIAGSTTEAWLVQVSSGSSPNVAFAIRNTIGSSYLAVNSSSLSLAAWHHVVCIKETGNRVNLYLDNVLDATSSSTSGTIQQTDSTYRIYLGTDQESNLDLGTDPDNMRISKLAIYNKQLSIAEINDHYLAMVAT